MTTYLKIYRDVPSGLPTQTSSASEAQRRQGEKLLREATFSGLDDPVFDVTDIPSLRSDEPSTKSAFKAERRGSLDLSPLTPEQALRAFMQVDPRRVAEREKAEREARRRPKGKAARLEDEEDIADALEALEEPDGPTLEEIKAKLGL